MGSDITKEYLQLVDSFAKTCKEAEKQSSIFASALEMLNTILQHTATISSSTNKFIDSNVKSLQNVSTITSVVNSTFSFVNSTFDKTNYILSSVDTSLIKVETSLTKVETSLSKADTSLTKIVESLDLTSKSGSECNEVTGKVGQSLSQVEKTSSSTISPLKNTGKCVIEVTDNMKGLYGEASNMVKSFDQLSQSGTECQEATEKVGQSFSQVEKKGSLTISPLRSTSKYIVEVTDNMQGLYEEAISLTDGMGNVAEGVGNVAEEMDKAGDEAVSMNNTFNGLQFVAMNIAFEAVGLLLKEAIKRITEYLKEQKNIKKAAQDLGPLLENMGKRMSDTGKNAKDAISGLSEYRESLNDLIKSRGDFLETTKKKAFDINVDIALIDQYKETIVDLTRGASLGAEEQAKLQAAVAGVNEICGTNIEVMDASTGRLSESIGMIDLSTEAWKRNAIAQATQEVYLELNRDLIKTNLSREAAERKLREEQEKSIDGFDEWGRIVVSNANEISRLEEEIKKLEKSEKELVGQIESAGNALAANQIVISSASDDIRNYVKTSEAWSNALDNNKFKIDFFVNTLSNLGVSTGELNKIAGKDLASFATSFDGSTDDVMRKCVELGVFLPNKFKEIAKTLGPEVALGYLEGLDPHCADEVMREMGVESIDALKEELGISSPSARAAEIGMYLAEGFSQGIEDDESADLAAKRIAHQTLQTMKVEAAAEKASLIGENFSAGFAMGINSLQDEIEVSGTAISKAAKTGMESESTNASVWGGHLVGGLADGIRGAVGLVQNAASFIAGNIKSFLHFSRPDKGPLRDYETWMPDMVGGLASSLRKAAPVIYAEARAVAEVISENINDWEISISNQRKSTMYELATRGFPSASLHSVGTTNNYYTIDGVNYVPDSRMAELMAELFNILVRNQHMRPLAVR